MPSSSTASDSDDDEAPLLVNLETEGAADVEDVEDVEDVDVSELPPCPVTILSGFLGSGKTTLIQYILRSPDHKKRIAVIENEFGEGLAIESLIARNGVDNSSLTDLIELPNGCVCCTVKDSLVTTLESLIEKRRDLDYILIEASGMANPGPIASVFWLDGELESRLRLDGVVTLVDACHISQQLEETEEASQQIAYADRILLNKIDLVDSTKGIEALLKSMNPAAKIQTTTYSKVPDLDWILDAKCYDQNQKAKDFSKTVEQLQEENENSNEHDHSHEHGHDHDHDPLDCAKCSQAAQDNKQHSHTGGISTLAFSTKGTMDLEKINIWLASVLWPNQDEKDEVLRSMLEKNMREDPTNENAGSDGVARDGEASRDQQQVYRIKGVVSVRCNKDKVDEAEWELCDPRTGIHKRPFIIQAVYDLWECYASNETFDSGEERECKLVVIGRYLRRQDLQQGFHSCMLTG